MTDKKNQAEIEPISGRRNFLTSVITTGAIAAVTPQSVGAAEPINKLPSGLLSLIIGKNFNQPLNNLPTGLECLTLSKNYNQPLNNLPKLVKITRVLNIFL